MPRFTYKAIRESGESYTDTADAEDKFALARQMKQSGDTLVSAEEVSVAEKKPNAFLGITLVWGRVTLRDKIMFARNLSAMMSAGLSLTRALSVLERQTRNAAFKNTLQKLGASIQQGTALSAALAEFPDVFPPLFVSMVRAGEESGKLSDALNTVALQLNKTYQLKRKVRGAMMYPSIVVTAMVLVGVALMVFVVPTLTETFTELGVDLPLSTRFIIGASNFVKHNIVLSLGLLVVLVGGGAVWFRRPSGRRVFETTLLHTPVIRGMVRESNAAQTSRTLASLLASGVEIVQAMGITKNVIQNTHFKAVLAKAERAIPKGGSIAEAFLESSELYPPLLGEMVSVGEEAGNLPEMLLRVAEFYESEVEEKTKDLSTIIEPILMVIIGAAVGFFAVSMISPIYSISEVI